MSRDPAIVDKAIIDVIIIGSNLRHCTMQGPVSTVGQFMISCWAHTSVDVLLAED